MADNTSKSSVPAENMEVLGDDYQGTDPSSALTRSIRSQWEREFENWRENFEERTDPADITAYQRRIRDEFREAIGGFPERTPLNPTIVDRFQREGYNVEIVRFESQPDHHITGTLYLPDSSDYSPPYPGVVRPVGHSRSGKAADRCQLTGALLARNGIAVLVYDPICQGERYQVFEDDGTPRETPPMNGHNQLGISSIPLGRNTARFRIWDGIRSIDYLTSREEINANRLGATGSSGGGTLTAYLGALDGRLVATAPSCYITSFETFFEEHVAHDAEQNIHGQHAFGLNFPDLLMLRAPAPTLVCSATDDFFNIEGAWDSVRYAKRLYGRLGYPERIDIAEVEADHGFHRLLREAAVTWMVRWLCDEDRSVHEPSTLSTLPKDALNATPDGQVLHLDSERTVYEINATYADELANHRGEKWGREERKLLLDEVRDIAGVTPLDNLPDPKVKALGETRLDDVKIERLVLEADSGIPIPAVRVVPETVSGHPALCLHDDGKHAANLDSFIETDTEVLAVDPCGIGETDPAREHVKWFGEFGTDTREALAAYRFGESLVGWRADDILLAARWLRDQADVNGKQDRDRTVRLQATGNVGIPALHAAALESEQFADVQFSQRLTSWDDLVRAQGASFSYANLVHGALEHYDLPDLDAVLGDELTLEEPQKPNSS